VKTYFISITHNLTSLWRFSGNDARSLFWPYAITVAILVYAAMMTAMVPEMQRIAAGVTKPDDIATVDTSGVIWWGLLFTAIAAVLLAASVVRRLRDRGKSPLWALVPVVLTLISSVASPTNLAGMLSLSGWATFAMFATTLAGQLSMIYLIVLLAGRSRLSA